MIVHLIQRLSADPPLYRLCTRAHTAWGFPDFLSRFLRCGCEKCAVGIPQYFRHGARDAAFAIIRNPPQPNPSKPPRPGASSAGVLAFLAASGATSLRTFSTVPSHKFAKFHKFVVPSLGGDR